MNRMNEGSLTSLRAVILSFTLILLALLIWVVLALPEFNTGQQTAIMSQLSQSGVSHPVTAVLLNFRAYDTLLEIGVLLVVLLGVWSFGRAPYTRHLSDQDNPLLAATIHFLVPVFVVTAGYLLWAGATGPGGAFHAGAILGAAGILLVQVDRLPYPKRVQLIRLGASLGLLVFAAIALGVMPVSGGLLQYPLSWNSAFILLIEGAAAFSIGLILLGLYIGGQPDISQRGNSA